jgi:hypothetical protein
MMTTANKKKLPGIGIILLCIGVLVAAFLAARFIPIGGLTCGHGNWVGVAMPELEIAWQKRLEQAGMNATDVSASGIGETTACGFQTLLGPFSFLQEPPRAVLRSVYATIEVEDVTNDSVLGDIVLKIFPETEAMLKGNPIDGAGIDMTFISNESSKRIIFSPDQVLELHQQGLTSAQLFAALDERYSPPTPAPTP